MDADVSHRGFCGIMQPGDVYVGVPSMDSACRGLASHPNLRAHWGSKASISTFNTTCNRFKALLQPQRGCIGTRLSGEMAAKRSVHTWAREAGRGCCDDPWLVPVLQVKAVSRNEARSWELEYEAGKDGKTSTTTHRAVLIADVMTVRQGAEQPPCTPCFCTVTSKSFVPYCS